MQKVKSRQRPAIIMKVQICPASKFAQAFTVGFKEFAKLALHDVEAARGCVNFLVQLPNYAMLALEFLVDAGALVLQVLRDMGDFLDVVVLLVHEPIGSVPHRV